MSAFIQEVQIRWSDLDPNIHLRHSVYYDWGAFCRIAFLTDRGLSTEVMNQLQIGPILFREECIFRPDTYDSYFWFNNEQGNFLKDLEGVIIFQLIEVSGQHYPVFSFIQKVFKPGYLRNNKHGHLGFRYYIHCIAPDQDFFQTCSAFGSHNNKVGTLGGDYFFKSRNKISMCYRRFTR